MSDRRWFTTSVPADFPEPLGTVKGLQRVEVWSRTKQSGNRWIGALFMPTEIAQDLAKVLDASKTKPEQTYPPGWYSYSVGGRLLHYCQGLKTACGHTAAALMTYPSDISGGNPEYCQTCLSTVLDGIRRTPTEER